jgi:hypothetical protein
MHQDPVKVTVQQKNKISESAKKLELCEVLRTGYYFVEIRASKGFLPFPLSPARRVMQKE